MMADALIDFMADIVRWLHVIAAIAWLGFVLWLRRLAIRARSVLDSSADLEVWDTHSLGFWQTERVVRPKIADLEGLVLSFNLIRWLFGTGLLLFCLIYYRQPQVYLLDPTDGSLSSRAAIALSLAGLIGAPLINEAINRIPLHRTTIYYLACALHVLAWSWFYADRFSQHGAMIQIGAMLGTTVSVNILGNLYPATRAAMVAVMRGEQLDPLRKQYWDRRNQHSFILPAIVFLMLSSHMGSAIKANGHAFATIVVVLVLSLASRHVIEMVHRNHGVVPMRLRWAGAAAAFALVLALAWLLVIERQVDLPVTADAATAAGSPSARIDSPTPVP